MSIHFCVYFFLLFFIKFVLVRVINFSQLVRKGAILAFSSFFMYACGGNKETLIPEDTAKGGPKIITPGTNGGTVGGASGVAPIDKKAELLTKVAYVFSGKQNDTNGDSVNQADMLVSLVPAGAEDKMGLVVDELETSINDPNDVHIADNESGFNILNHGEQVVIGSGSVAETLIIRYLSMQISGYTKNSMKVFYIRKDINGVWKTEVIENSANLSEENARNFMIAELKKLDK